MSGVALRQKIPPAAPDVGDLLKSIAAPKAEEESANEAPCQLVLHNDDYRRAGVRLAVRRASAISFRLANPASKSLPTMASMSRKRWTILAR